MNTDLHLSQCIIIYTRSTNSSCFLFSTELNSWFSRDQTKKVGSKIRGKANTYSFSVSYPVQLIYVTIYSNHVIKSNAFLSDAIKFSGIYFRNCVLDLNFKYLRRRSIRVKPYNL